LPPSLLHVHSSNEIMIINFLIFLWYIMLCEEVYKLSWLIRFETD
jgi:hypothetical protein